MKNLTLRVDEAVLEKARRIASERSTSVNSLVREYLNGLVERRTRAEQAHRELIEIAKSSNAQIGNATWTRDELHER